MKEYSRKQRWKLKAKEKGKPFIGSEIQRKQVAAVTHC